MFVRVAVPVPSLDLLTYAVPAGQAAPRVGARVVAPLGSRKVTGIVVEVTETSGLPDGAAVKPLMSVLDAEPFIPSDVVELARWTADYYCHPFGDAMAAALPKQYFKLTEKQRAKIEKQ